jgi:LysR family glycine cleavage system transcriptional activator
MASRLPPLNSLRAFEAGARHLSFTKAAAELNVTPAAVSHQVKALEEDLGVKLFRRLIRKLVLTEQGRRLSPVLSEAFELMTAGVEELRQGSETPTLTVTVTPSFSSKWLVGRLGRFWERHPEIDLRLHHSIQVMDLAREGIDLAVRWGRGTWPGLTAECLLEAEVTPVCSPALLTGERPLKSPADLQHQVLIHEDDHANWIQWLAAAGVEGVDPRRGPVMDDAGVVIEAAAAGRGVALGRLALVAGELQRGRLVRPFELSLESDFGYFLVYPPAALARPKVKAFRDFLMEEKGR